MPPQTRSESWATAATFTYEVDVWMWRSLMVSIAEAERIRTERLSERRTRAAETRKRRR
jgi:hypothetical protein